MTKAQAELERQRKISDRIAVYATVQVEGESTTRVARLWDSLPGWWHRSTEDQRTTWIQAFFARQLKVAPEQVLSAATDGK